MHYELFKYWPASGWQLKPKSISQDQQQAGEILGPQIMVNVLTDLPPSNTNRDLKLEFQRNIILKQVSERMQDARGHSEGLAQSSPTKTSEQYETRDQTMSVYQQCPTCSSHTSRVSYYSCCLVPACHSCYSGFHYLECPSAKRNKDHAISNFQQSNTQQKQSEICKRCEGSVGDSGYTCKDCRLVVMCEGCFWHVHNSPKFSAHTFHKYSGSSNTRTHETLNCSIHNKLRTLLTQNGQAVCPDCLPRSSSKRPKQIAFTPSSREQRKEEVEGLVKSIIFQSVGHRNKWNQLREDLREEYHKLNRMINDRYDQNILLLKQMEDFDMRLVDKAVQESRKIMRETEINTDELGIDRNLFVMRLAILSQNLLKWKAQIQATEQYIHKISPVDSEKLEVLLKSFTVSKARVQIDDKQNQSVRKPTPSLYKNNSNLSISRRSLSKSISKVDNPHLKANTDSKNNRMSILKDSTASVNASLNINANQSVNLSKQVKTQPMRNSTPAQGGKTGMNSSDKKSNLLRQSSIMTAKIEDITPVLLNFDSKESNGSRINFMSNKTEEQSAPNLSLAQNDHNASQSRISKRKSDYFELRDRMRKPNIVNNRFSRR